jgi:hypothetical protein
MDANLKKRLDNLPVVNCGCRGVSLQISEVLVYLEQAGLIAVKNRCSAVERGILDNIGWANSFTHYNPGGPGRCSTYSDAYITDKAQYETALATMPAGLRAEVCGLVTVPARGRRTEWRYSPRQRKWVVVRQWVLQDGVMFAGRPHRVGPYSVQRMRRPLRAYETTLPQWRITEGGQRFTSYVESRTKALRQHVRAKFARRPNPQEITVRMLERLCPPDWTVVCTPIADDKPRLPAYREVATGEEYHFFDSCSNRHPVADARRAFAARAAARDRDLVKRRDLAEVWVRWSDSVDAGNCVVGTQEFATKQRLDLRRHYPALDLLARSNGYTPFVQRAIVSAVRRQRVETQQGYCEVPRMEDTGVINNVL